MKWSVATVVVAVVGVCWLGGEEEMRDGERTTLPGVPPYDPCCAHPCQNTGVCVSYPDRTYTCDCTNTAHSGFNCSTPDFFTGILHSIRPHPDTVHNLITTDLLLWRILNRIPFISDFLMKLIFLSRGDMVDSPVRFESDHAYPTLDAYFNETYYGRELPPVPLHCPTPVGIVGPKTQPPIQVLIERIFARTEFIPEPHQSNGLFQYYAQHFTHQFFRTDYDKGGAFTKGYGGVDVSNIYGLTEKLRRALRSNEGGKLRYQMIAGEMFPPFIKDTPGATADLPPHIKVDANFMFALGHPFFVLLPGLFMYSTLWLREHNRVCDVLGVAHPDWDDERLYHTARLIITAQVIKVTIEDYVQHLSQYKVKLHYHPEVVHGTRFQYDNRIKVEFNHMYHWHPLVPEVIEVANRSYPVKERLFNVRPALDHGLDTFIHAASRTRAGKLGPHNHPFYTRPTLTKMLNISRQLRFQSFNQYRRRFQLPPYESFWDLTLDQGLADTLRELYGHVDAVEFYVGLICERPNHSPSVTPMTMVNMGGPWSVKGLIANPVGSPLFWKPSTFGGDVGFNIVKTFSFTKLLCNNMKDKTDCEKIGFRVPEGTP